MLSLQKLSSLSSRQMAESSKTPGFVGVAKDS